MNDFYDKAGNKIDMSAWGKLYKDKTYVRVASTLIIGDATDPEIHITVSTVWLGMNHNWVEGAPPLIFETMIFDGQYDSWCQRYTTLAEAEAGHKQVVDRLLVDLPPDGEPPEAA